MTLYTQAGVLGCRGCLSLAYPSQNEREGLRAARKANRIAQRMGWLPVGYADTRERPKWLHSATFKRLEAEYRHYAAIGNAALAQRAERLMTRLEAIGSQR